MSDATSSASSVLLAVVIVLVAVLVALAAWALYKGRAFAQGNLFRASRLSRGNRLFPTQVLISPTSVVHHTPQWIGKLEHSIHMAHVASVSIDTHFFFSDVYIETTGGTTPIHCRGHRKGDAVRMKQLIEQYQTAYYLQGGVAPAPAGSPRPS
jgi:hypothetical protein